MRLSTASGIAGSGADASTVVTAASWSFTDAQLAQLATCAASRLGAPGGRR